MTDQMPQPIADLPRILELPDPAERAKGLGAAAAAVPAFQTWLRVARQAAIVQMRKDGKTWDQIGEELDMHPQRASQIARGMAGGSKRREPSSAIGPRHREPDSE